MVFIDKIYHALLRRFDSPRYNDSILRAKNVVWDGALPLGKKAAIYLIFPKAGLLKSHQLALQYMIENGYSPIVVSNLPLSEDDLNQLRPLTYRILQRENFGYDFGGYREGILVFQDEIKTLDHLALFNDSVWFPLAGAHNWLKDAEATGWDCVGSGSHEAPRLDDLFDYFDKMRSLEDTAKTISPHIKDSWIEFFLDKSAQQKAVSPFVQAGRDFFRRARFRRNFHYNSFALLLGRNILADQKFYDFFRAMKISSDKRKTILRGEIGFTTWVVAKGYRHGATLQRTDLAKHLATLDDETFELYWQNQNFPAWRGFFDLMRVRLPNIAINQFNRAQKEGFMDMINHQYPFPFVATHYITRSLGYGFLKKGIPQVRRADLVFYADLFDCRQEPLRAEIMDYFQKRYDEGR